MSAQLIQVQFHGDTLDACGTCEQDAEVSIRRVCENLGISTQGQLAKLKRKAWATVNEKVMVAEDGKPRDVATIALKSLPMWLATIDARKVKEQFREKLARYQQECHDVLARHFLSKPADTVSLPRDLFEQLTKLPDHVANLQQQLNRLAAESRAIESGSGPRLEGPFWTVAAWLEENLPQWNATAAQRHAIGQDAKRRVKRACPGEQVGYFNRDLAFVAHQEFYLAKAAQHAHRKAMRDDKAEDYGLFAETDAKA